MSGDGPFYEGGRLDKYRLVARLGAGGMAEIFLGRIEGPAGFTKPVAIKRMRPELTSNREFVDLFLEEARTAARLSHPNICHVHELTAAGDQYFMVMEYLEGVPVSTLMLRTQRDPRLFEVPFIAGIVEQAAEGLHHAHEMTDEQGNPLSIIHRDVSPPNLFVTTGGVVKVLDFGISKSRNSLVRTMTGQIRGKFAYMSPEQLRGETLDRRSDVFSLGIVLFELMTGRRLFRRKSRLDIFHAIVKEPLPLARHARPDLPEPLAAVIDRALARDREERFASARELADALGSATAAYGGPAQSAAIGARIQECFAAELASKRELLSAPNTALLGEKVADVGETQTTLPTTNLRTSSSEHTIPAEADHHDFVDTSAATQALTAHDATAVDLEAAPPASGDPDDDAPIPPPSTDPKR